MTLRIVITLSCLTLIPNAAGAADTAPAQLTIEEWQVPWDNTRPRDPYVGPDGDVWFVGQRGHYVAELDPASGDFRRIDLDDGTGPHNLIVADDGTLYYAGNRAAHIGRIDPESGTIHKIPMPDQRARDPHTLVFDAEGDIYFTVQGGNMVGRLDVDSEAVTLTTVPTENARPYGIVVAPNGTVWATAFGTNKLLEVDPETVAVSEIVLPREGARPRRLQATSDGRIWLTYRLSKAASTYAVITVPAALKETVSGRFQLLTRDGRDVGTLAAKDGRAWGLGAFLRRRGAKMHDRVRITLDLDARTAVIELGEAG